METAGIQNIDQDLTSLIALTKIASIGPKTCRQILQHFGSASEVFRAAPRSLLKIPHIGQKLASALKTPKLLQEAEREIAFAEKQKIKIVSWENEAYPKKLKEISDSPLVLYCAGHTPPPDKPHIAIVGTRRPSEYGRKIAADFASYFAQLGIVVVSGLAYGIDMEAHSATLCAGGSTTAVLGHGLEMIYPREHTRQAQQIVEGGGQLLTEFPIGTKPEAYNFPARNRIISGLCEAVLVVEATEKGGALITARMAFEQNRDVYAVPGNIGNATSVGCNQLIRDHVAKIACGPQDVLDGMQHLLRYDVSSVEAGQPKAALMLSEREQTIYDQLKLGPLGMDELAARTQIFGNDLRGLLLGLEFRGVVRSAAGNKFQIGY